MQHPPAVELLGVEQFRLHSARNGGQLEIGHARRDRWQVTLSLAGLSASADVDACGHDGEHTLDLLFRRLADDWRGWEGERTWSSLEGDLDLAATHDGLGHVALRVRLRSGPYEEDWLATGTIWLEAGQLDATARDAAAFTGAR
jgi:Family of unknown function (DUF6228)